MNQEDCNIFRFYMSISILYFIIFTLMRRDRRFLSASNRAIFVLHVCRFASVVLINFRRAECRRDDGQRDVNEEAHSTEPNRRGGGRPSCTPHAANVNHFLREAIRCFGKSSEG